MPTAPVTLAGPLPALLYPPADFDPASEERWPLLLFLHGSGERGRDLARVRSQGLPPRLDAGLSLPAYVLAPQCPDGVWWNPAQLAALLDAVEAAHPSDPQRLSVTGLSMGGYGTWALALHQPERFSALAPICGGGDPSRAREIAHLPQWVFHGARDEVVPLAESERMVAALRAAGADVRFTVYPEAGHDAWTPAYGEAELLPWLIEQRREGKEERSEG